MNKRETALMRLSAVQFTLWEMHLYLDTHPWDIRMVEQHNRIEASYRTMRKAFEDEFYPLTTSEGHGVEWLKGPWPWEYEECGC